MNFLFNYSNNPNDYYFKTYGNNRKYYFIKDNDQKVAQIFIPKNIINKIKENDEHLSFKRKIVEQQIANEKLLKKYKNQNDEYVSLKRKIVEQEIENEKLRKKQKDKFFESINKKTTSDNILEKYNIYSKKQWLEWLRKNHVDKGGELHICQNVIAV